MKKVAAIKALEDFRLWVRFFDGTEGIADLSDLAGKGVFTAWRESGYFNTARVTEFGAVAWGEDIDLCPDTLYLRATGKQVGDLFPATRESLAKA